MGELILELDGGRTTRVVAPATMTGVVGGGGSTTIDAAFDDRVVMGVVREGGVESSLRGTDVADADAVVLCGTYEGVSVDGSAVSGTWSFTIDASGEIVGRFDQGALTGRVSGSTVSIDWIGEGAAAGYSGQAMGTLDGDRSAVSGTWGGSGGSTSGGGTFASSAGGCPSGVVTPPARSDALPSGCDCVVGGACCGGLCCVP
ncbi:MAG: hypothetical protein M5U28_22460 [Sandaracinaceae bacterium]|nr:hypothetical protein [Sandaracinaceae bacterium]